MFTFLPVKLRRIRRLVLAKASFHELSAIKFLNLTDYLFIYLFVGLGRLAQAEKYLSQAKWTVTKTPECKDDIKSKLHRNLGNLYATQENYENALKHLAEDVRIYFILKLIFAILV